MRNKKQKNKEHLANGDEFLRNFGMFTHPANSREVHIINGCRNVKRPENSHRPSKSFTGFFHVQHSAEVVKLGKGGGKLIRVRGFDKHWMQSLTYLHLNL